MKLAIAYSTKDRIDLTRQTFPVLADGQHALFWLDGSTEQDALDFANENMGICTAGGKGVVGGADAAIVAKLTMMLDDPTYTHVGLVENDVLLDPDWLEPTLSLFERGKADDLEVGAVSARSYVDRVLIQRDSYAVMHNLGAGMVVFTREAAQLVLDNFRTHWAPHVRQTWMRLAGIDIGRYWAFRGNEQWVTSDWGYDAFLASYGLASLALTPAKCGMIGQVPPLHEQGLTLTTGALELMRSDEAFETLIERTRQIREGHLDCNSPVMDIDPCIGGERIIFPHLAPKFGATYAGDWRLKWSQGLGPFAYRAGAGGASLRVPVFGSCSFMVSGGANGARCSVRDPVSGYELSPPLAPETESNISNIVVPGGVTYRELSLDLEEGAVFYGIHTPHEQPWDPSIKFDYSTLPPV